MIPALKKRISYANTEKMLKEEEELREKVFVKEQKIDYEDEFEEMPEIDFSPWLKNFKDGAVLCVYDCTGHGTPGALLTMLVVSILDRVVTESNYKDPAAIMWELEKHLVIVMNVEDSKQKSNMRGLTINDGCDLAVLYVAKDGSVTASMGNTCVFICDGKNVTRIKGQKIHIGDNSLQSKNDIKTINIPANPDNKFYIASDGLYQQIGGRDKLPFGYETLEKIILENHREKQNVISDMIWLAFEQYRGENSRRDDFQLISFQPKGDYPPLGKEDLEK